MAPRMTLMDDVNSLSSITPGLSPLVAPCTCTYSRGRLFSPSLTDVLSRQSARHRYGSRRCSVKLFSSSNWNAGRKSEKKKKTE